MMGLWQHNVSQMQNYEKETKPLTIVLEAWAAEHKTTMAADIVATAKSRQSFFSIV